MDTCRECYEAYVIYNFMVTCFNVVSPNKKKGALNINVFQFIAIKNNKIHFNVFYYS